MAIFEKVAQRLESMDVPTNPDHLSIEWFEEGTLAVGRDSRGAHCVLLVGGPLQLTLASVQHAIRHGTWRSESDQLVQGNLLSLPQGEEFLTATAAIVAELVRRGISKRPVFEVFAEVEEFVALVLRRVLLPPDFVLGLVGELIVVNELVKALASSGRTLEDPTVWWRGWMRQSRDFVLGSTSIEIKTTGLQVSRHHIQGLDQIEPRKLDGTATERLILGSIGLRRAPTGIYSVAGITDQVLQQLVSDDARNKFLDRLRQYGPEDSTGYIHDKMSALDPYTEAYVTTFPPRFYEMADDNIRIIRSSDVAELFPHVRAQGLSCTIELPASIPGSIENPHPDFRQLLQTLVAS